MITIGMCGVSCSGKTTLALDITARLKSEYHQLVEVVCSQDRKTYFPNSRYGECIEAHFGIITKLISAQCDAQLRGDCNIVVTDRTPLDLLANAIVDHPNHKGLDYLRDFALYWCSTFTRIYYVPRFPYVDDNVRPSTDILDREDEALKELVRTYPYNNLKVLKRQDIFSDVRKAIGCAKDGVLCFLEERYKEIARASGFTFYVKPSYNYDLSDVDIYYVVSSKRRSKTALDVEQFKQLFNLFFDGRRFEFDFVPIPDVKMEGCTRYAP